MTVGADRPPTPRPDLAASVDDQQVELSWTANSEPDLAGYNLYLLDVPPVPHDRHAAERRDAC